MALIHIIESFQPRNDEALLAKAEAAAPALHHSTHHPKTAWLGLPGRGGRLLPAGTLTPLEKGDTLVLDLGDHYVGTCRLTLTTRGSHPDAPAWLRLRFAEILDELYEAPEDYHGWVSSSWIQDERVHVDLLPGELALPRRYAFRYLAVEVLDTSPKYKLVVDELTVDATTSADDDALPQVRVTDPELDRVYRVGLRTLRSCMQREFEDGPKRDRRLWIGDLRLQALSNAASYRNMDLVRRCLYLFGGTRFPDGRVSACLFTQPEPAADDTWLFDYGLFYPVILEEYLRERPDSEALADLGPIALEQLHYALGLVGEDGVVNETATANTFVDWQETMDKTACAQSILIYALGYGEALANRLGRAQEAGELAALRAALAKTARARFWDPARERVVSGGQENLASLVWMILAGVLTPQEADRALAQADELSKNGPMMTPYMHHYYITALLIAGRREQALGHIRYYWSSMIRAGADTFWEAWIPEHPDASPYGGRVINSYCHAWSCTPVYLLHTHFPELLASI